MLTISRDSDPITVLHANYISIKLEGGEDTVVPWAGDILFSNIDISVN